MNRSDLPRPSTTMLVDLNSEAAYAARGETARKAPRLLPVPYETVAPDPGRLLLEPWRKNLSLYPQLYFIVDHDVPVGDEAALRGAVRGLGLGLAFSDDGILLASPDPSPRDRHMCYWYSLYSDSSQVLADALTPGLAARDLRLTVESPTLGRHVFDQSVLLFDPDELLREMNCFVAFAAGDLISLGAAGAPLAVPADRPFAPGETITVSCEALGTLAIAVDDRRDPGHILPGWTPRDYYYHPGR